MESWTAQKILILGKTYPAYSDKYTETACTGGLLDESFRMVRLYPIPYRYLESDTFSDWQWISARIKKDSSDPRPESFKVDFRSITPLERVEAKQSKERRRFLEHSPHLCRSVEHLKQRQQDEGISLGIVKPKEVLEWDVEGRDEAEREDWEEKERRITAQFRLLDGPVKPLDFPEAKFVVKWRCDDDSCKTHRMALHQWGIHELNRKLRGDPDIRKKILTKMAERLDTSKRDVFLFLGSFRGKMFNFGLMDSFSIPLDGQLSLM